jgi:hypothetical protein
MSQRRAHILFAAGVSSAVLAGQSLAVAKSSGATTSDTITETSVATFAATTVATAQEMAVVGGVEILPPDEGWAGLTRGEWAARRWQWGATMPEDVHPAYDVTGDERCGYGQSGPVFFMPGGPGVGVPLRCVVAEGIAILIDVASAECSTVEPPPFFGRTEDELRACASASLDQVTQYHARINGQEVADLDAYRVGTPLFTITLPEGNIYGLEPGVAQAVEEGYSFIIAPPPPGEYRVTISVGGSFTFTRTFIVEAPQVIEPPTT